MSIGSCGLQVYETETVHFSPSTNSSTKNGPAWALLELNDTATNTFFPRLTTHCLGLTPSMVLSIVGWLDKNETAVWWERLPYSDVHQLTNKECQNAHNVLVDDDVICTNGVAEETCAGEFDLLVFCDGLTGRAAFGSGELTRTKRWH